MPPYKPVKSKAQRRKLFALAERGEISMAEAEGKARAAKGLKLPERVRPKKVGGPKFRRAYKKAFPNKRC